MYFIIQNSRSLKEAFDFINWAHDLQTTVEIVGRQIEPEETFNGKLKVNLCFAARFDSTKFSVKLGVKQPHFII